MGLFKTVSRSAGSDVDYVADGVSDQVEIQTAINALSSTGGGVVYLKAGTYNLGGMVLLASNVCLRGEPGTKVIQVANYAIKLANVTNVRIENIHFDANGMTAGNYYSIYAENVQRVWITGNRVENAAGFGIFVTSNGTNTTKNVWIQNNQVTGLGTSDVIGGGPAVATAIVTDIFVENNFVSQDSTRGNGHKDAINFVAAQRVRFANNIVEGSILFGTEKQPHAYATIQGNLIRKAVGATRAAVGLCVDPTATQTGEGVIIANNAIQYGFIDVYSNPTTRNFFNVVVSGNIINASGINSADGEAGIRTEHVECVAITGNVITDATGDAIWLCDGKYGNITGNIIRNPRDRGVRIDGSCEHSVISGNTILGCAANMAIVAGSTNLNVNNKVL